MPRGSARPSELTGWFDEYLASAGPPNHLGVDAENLLAVFRERFGPNITKGLLRRNKVSESVISILDIPEGDTPPRDIDPRIATSSDGSPIAGTFKDGAISSSSDPSDGNSVPGTDVDTGDADTGLNLTGTKFIAQATGIVVAPFNGSTYDVIGTTWLCDGTRLDSSADRIGTSNEWYNEWITQGYVTAGKAYFVPPYDCTINKISVLAHIAVSGSGMVWDYRLGSTAVGSAVVDGFPYNGKYTQTVSESLNAGDRFEMSVGSISTPSAGTAPGATNFLLVAYGEFT